MMHWRILLTVILIPDLLLAGCSLDNKSVQNTTQYSSSSSQKGKDNMPTQSPMFNEILASAKGIAPGKYNDVSHIVSKYIPIGTSKEQAKEILESMYHRYTEEEGFIRTGYRGELIPFVPTPGISIEFHFNQSDYLELIDAKFRYYQ